MLWPLLAVMLLLAPAAAAAGIDPAAPVLRLHAGIVAAGAASWPPDRQALERLLGDSFDLAGLARAVLGTTAATPQQCEKLAASIGAAMLQFVAQHRPDAADRFDLLETRSIGAGDWLVLTRVAPAGQPEAMLGWRVQARPDGPRIVDVLRNGVSAVITRRHDIAAALRSRDLDTVIAELARAATADGR